jgi:hypothetical protein
MTMNKGRGQMSLRKCVSTALLFFLAGNAFAATEYLRFAGDIDGSSVYLDFQVDTNLNVAGRPDQSWKDNFYVRYLAGSLGVPGTTTYGQTNTFPEGKTSHLFVNSSLAVGSYWHNPVDFNEPFDDSINTWAVGDQLWLLDGGPYFDKATGAFYFNNITGALALTHRSNTVLPVHVVPLPQAAWLFASALLVLVGVRKQK